MRRLLTAFVVLAIINLLGILGAVGWLAATQRLSGDRIEAIRQILHEPVPVEVARLEAEAKAAEVEIAEAKPEERPLPESPPLSSDQLVSLQEQQGDAMAFRVQRSERESSMLGRTIDQETKRLDEARHKFEAERDRFEAMRAEIAAIKGDEQFQAALSVLSQVKPDKAMAMLQEIIDGRAGAVGAGGEGALTGKDRAVAYLDELDEMVRGKIMSEFVDESPTLAADLLERLRTFGLMADASGGTGP